MNTPINAGIDIGAGEPSVAQLGEQAAHAVRALNHLTRPSLGALSDPGQAAELTAALADLAGALPQLLGQLTGWLDSQQQAGRIRVDACSRPDPTLTQAALTQQALTQQALTQQAVRRATAVLAQAGDCAHAAGAALDAGHQILARLATVPSGRGNQPEGRR